jgi:pimeloyl-ACP methyl ester carboxylesterase
MSHVAVEGRSIAYDHYTGSGDPLVFVHGWCCGRWAFAPQVAHFLARGHEILTLDLPGHGDSDPLDGPISMATLADAVRGTMAGVGIDQAIVVGHSMGAATALVLAGSAPEVVKAVVAVDPAPMVARFPDLEPIAGANVAFRADDATREKVFRAFVEGFFHPVAPDSIKQLAVRQMTGAPVDTMMGCWEAMYDLDGPAVLAAVHCPVLHIAATPPLNPVEMFASMVSDCTTGSTVGAGHFNQLEVPAQVNSMIEHFLVALAAR